MIESASPARLAQTSTFRIKKSEGNTHMSIATGRHATVSVEVGGREITFETGKLAKQADGAVVVRSGDTMILATAVGRTGGPPRRGLLPADRRRRGEDVRRGEDPRRLLQARRQGVRAGDPDRAHDRPPDPAALAEGLQERGAGHLHRPLRGHDPRARRALHQRRVGGARDLAAAVPRAGRRGARGADRRRARRQPDAAGGRRGVRPRPDRRRHARRAHDDRGRRRTRCPRTTMLRGVRARARRDQAHLRRDRGPPRPGRKAEVGRPRADGRARAHARRCDLARIQEQGLEAAGSIVDEIVDEICPDITLDSTEEDIVREMQVKAGLALVLDKQRLVAVEGPGARAVRERAARADRCRAGLEDAQVPQARHPHTTGSSRTCSCRSPSPTARPRARTRRPSRGSRRRRTRSTRTSSARRSPSTSAAPTAAARRRSGRSASRSGYSPRTHGSGLFTRGETQILTLCTLGTAKEGQRIDDLSLESDRRYMHHYNFPPFSVGETGFMRGPKRRDIGHGALAQRALAGRHPERPRSSRTRSGSSPRHSSRTARRRWARSAARRSR